MLKRPLPPEVIAAFHAMWDNFPEPVSLVHKSREVIALNKAHYLKPGIYCAKTGKNGPHMRCQANKALAEKQAIGVISHDPASKRTTIIYWVPLEEYPDYFIHFSVRLAIDYEDKSVSFKPLTEEEKRELSYIGRILFGNAFGKPARRFPAEFSFQITKAVIKRAVRASVMLPLGVSGGSGVHAGKTSLYSFLCHVKAS